MEPNQACYMSQDCFVKMLLSGVEHLNKDVQSSSLKSYLTKNCREIDPHVLAIEVAQLLLNPQHSLLVARTFPQILLLLLKLASKEQHEVFENGGVRALYIGVKEVRVRHLRLCVSLGKLVTIHPDAVRFSVDYFTEHLPPFEYLKNKNDVAVLSTLSGEALSNLDIVIACYCFLHCNEGDYFRKNWNWSQLASLLQKCVNEKMKWVIIQCVATASGMADWERQKLLQNHLSDDKINSCLLWFNNYLDDLKIQFSTLHLSNVILPTTTIIGDVVNVCGVQLPILKSCKKKPGYLHPVATTLTNLRRLAMGTVCGKAICLQGPVGCGKTALIEHLGELTGRVGPPDLIKVQLGDQTDSKLLLGSYRCTDVPGEFVWQSGLLTQAVENGSWILLEDIDSASSDLISVLASLLETKMLCVPGYCDTVPVARGFQLFLTRRILNKVRAHSTSKLLESHWLHIDIDPLQRGELLQVVKGMFPQLEHVSERLVDTFFIFSTESNEQDTEDISLFCNAKLRLISTRDLLKWCRRSNKTVIPGSKESNLKVYQDAIDIFCCSDNLLDKREDYAKAIGNKLGINHTQATYFCKLHNPTVTETENQLIIGRAMLAKNDNAVMSIRRKVLALAPSVARLLERVARSVEFGEPVLLVGETGTGKTHLVQHLADKTRNRLLVLNMNQQSESADLLGGYKPLDLRFIIKPVFEEYEKLFNSYYSPSDNMQFLIKIGKCFNERKWTLMLNVMKHTCTTALNSLEKVKLMTPVRVAFFQSEWNKMCDKINKLERQINTKSKLAFSFIEGSLVEAVRKGYWVLLDEINLASAETLECLSGLLEEASASLQLLEKGNDDEVEKHPNFRLFACMNPATDVGKRDLPAGLRNRFTEFFVDEILLSNELQMLVASYLQNLALPTGKITDLVNFYRNVKKSARTDLSDGTGNKPHYSLRTLCRALIAAQTPFAAVSRTLYEAFCMSFLTQLDYSSHQKVENMIMKAVFGGKEKGNALQNSVLLNCDQKNYVCFEGFWIKKGPLDVIVPDKYILTKSVRRNLHDLVRVVSLAQLPVLLQGETSVGKTSLITYLAKATGHHCIRINNHEHTDLQEYIGSYVADENGFLVFREGALIEAMRKGHWIILDELNLAPTDVLEALNRVLDDNRELFIPETQEVVKSHPQFMLFATQNPPGLYGGRKMLSRAFRNRFVELHFDKIPPNELEIILHERCELPASYCKRLVAVMEDLQIRRRGSQAFAGRHGFMTLRDLFRWGERYRLATHQTGFYDWDLHMAEEGYLLLAGRVRCKEEEEIICDVLKRHFKIIVQPKQLFTMSERTSQVTLDILQKIDKLSQVNKNSGIVWTYNMRRMAVLICKAFKFGEPVLLVGETGCGKTTVCQVLAQLHQRNLSILNCHMHSESSDFLGGLRPTRNKEEDSKSPEGVQKLFEWVDGPLVKAMQEGSWFLCDEISLADDSVLERMNSLLEPDRKLLLAEKGTGGNTSNGIDTSFLVVADPEFRFLGTMNPGGDYGKKELSPALRNRFTEVWCDSNFDHQDLKEILQLNQKSGFDIDVSTLVLDFLEWFRCTKIGNKFQINIRDLITWIGFYNTCSAKNIKSSLAYIHGACLTLLDSFGTGVTSNENIEELNLLRRAALHYLSEQVRISLQEVEIKPEVQISSKLIISPFFLEMGPENHLQHNFTFTAPTTASNAMRVLRGLQLSKPLLLEGSPGVGKTSLVTAIAQAAGYSLVRINISEQTDISDLFGADLPVEGGKGGEFAWRDGPFLRALKNGHWILLDELNLASQSVLEGLNACFDHRGEVYIPELDRTFYLQSQTHLFATQNPQRQGGARKGLPRSFLNRFTQVYIDKLDTEDLRIVLSTTFPTFPVELIDNMISFNNHMTHETGPLGHWGSRGGPWEFNLRDLSRWAAAVTEGKAIQNPSRYLQLIYADRMRTKYDRDMVIQLASKDSFECKNDDVDVTITPRILYVSEVAMERHTTNSKIGTWISQGNLANICSTFSASPMDTCDQPIVLRSLQQCLRSLLQCLHMGWMPILVGPSGSGKTKLAHLAAQLAGRELQVLSVNSAMDTSEILGGFEQVNYWHHLMDIIRETQGLIQLSFRFALMHNHSLAFMEPWQKFMKHYYAKRKTRDVTEFIHQISELERILSSLETHCNPLTKSLLDFINGKLEKVKYEVNCDNKLNTGGKFEWVDSILIKALNKGCWLLLDNVNLCSPAVLDRLNALLEPNGKLTIEERGILPNGNLVSITPHPSFRLIMTMDPVNGEISRSMRNRGVEIFIHRDELFTEIDEMCVAFNSGVKDYYMQEALLDVHHAIGNITTGGNTLSALHETGQLVYENLIRGHQTYELFLANCFEVYARQGTFGRSRIQDCIVVALEHHRNTLMGHANNSLKPYALEEIMLVASKFVANTSFSSLRLNSAPVTIAISYMGKSISPLRKIFKLDSEWTQQELLPGFVFVLYATSCLSTLELCHKWIASATNKSNVYTTLTSSGNFIHNSIILSKALLTVLQKNMKTEYVQKALSHFKNELVDADFLPWDIQWVPFMQLMKDESQHKLKVYASAVNSLHILNYLEYRKFIEFSENSSENHQKKHFTILSLSEEFIAGKLSELQVPQSILLQQMSPLLKLVNDLLKTVVLSGQINVGRDNLPIFLNAIHWYIQFAKQANFSVAEVKNNISQLYQHFFWLYYYTIKPVLEVCMDNNISRSNLACLLNSLVKNVKEELSQSISPLVVFSADVRKLMGHILTPNIQICSVLDRFSNKITFSAKRSTENSMLVEKIKEFTTSEEGKNAVNNLIIGYHLMWDVESAECRVSELMNQVSECFEAGLQIESDQLNITHNDPSKLQDQGCLWPLFEILELRLGFALLSNFTGSNNTINTYPVSKLIASLPGVPPLLKALNLYLGQNITTRQEVRLYELIECFLRHVMDSYATNIYIKVNQNDLESFCDERSNLVHIPLHCPLLTLHSIILISPHPINSLENRFGSLEVSLNMYNFHCQKLQSVRSFIWKNASVLFDELLNPILNDAKSCLAAVHKFVNILSEQYLNLERSKNCNLQQLKECIIGTMSKNMDLVSLKILESNLNNLVAAESELVNALRVNSNNTEEANLAIVKSTGELWIAFGHFQFFMFSFLGLMDPVEKRKIKMSYMEQEKKEMKCLSAAFETFARLHGRSWERLPESSKHPFLTALTTCLSSIESVKCNSSENCTFRPQGAPKFDVLKKELINFTSNLTEKSKEMWNHISKYSDYLLNCGLNDQLDNIQKEKLLLSSQDLLLRANNMQQSQTVFVERLTMEYKSYYPDLTAPLTTALTQISYGMNIICNVISKMSARLADVDVNTQLEQRLEFPFIRSSVAELLQTAGNYQSYQDISSDMRHLGNVMTIVDKSSSCYVWEKVHKLLNSTVALWQEIEDKNRLQQKEKDSLFVHKSSKVEAEDYDEAEGFEGNFPSWIQKDFSDMQQATLEKKIVQNIVIEDCLQQEQLHSICELHCDLVQSYSYATWLSPKQKLKANFVESLKQKYLRNIAELIETCKGASNTVDMKLMASLVVFSSSYLGNGETCGRETIDFYHDEQVHEVKRCMPILVDLRTNIINLLQQWPDHPTLNEIIVVMERILKFPISSPIPRFLTGLELLLGKINDWEQNAHQGVSLMGCTNSIKELVVDWRKLELASWKMSLDSAYKRYQKKALRWWFHLYAVIEAYLSEENKSSPSELQETLKLFISSSTLGDFDVRLDLLYKFHCHVIHFKSSQKQEMLLRLLWNIHSQFTQLQPSIASYLKNMRSPIEKKLKDFIKVARWHDMSYWAITESIAKSHRTVHKFIKEFEKVLSQCAMSPGITVPLSEIYLSIKCKEVNLLGFLADIPLRILDEESKMDATNPSALYNIKNYFLKSRKLCKEIIRSCDYTPLFASLSYIMNELLERTDSDKNAQIDYSQSKDQQKARAKHLLNIRRKTLTDLFHALQMLGLSYRVGLQLNTEPDISLLELPVIELSVLLSSTPIHPLTDVQLLLAWSNSDQEFSRASMMMTEFDKTIKSPSSDLGVGNIERLKGFASHLMSLAREQKNNLFISTSHLHKLREEITQISMLNENEFLQMKPTVVLGWKNRVVEVLVITHMCLEQFSDIMNSCPSSEDHELNIPSIQLSENRPLPSIALASKGDSTWSKAMSFIQSAKEIIHQQKCNIENVSSIGGVSGVCWGVQCELLVNTYNKLENVMQLVKNVIHIFEEKNGLYLCNPIARSLHWLLTFLQKSLSDFWSSEFKYSKTGLEFGHNAKSDTHKMQKTEFKTNFDTYVSKLNYVITNILLIIQEEYKKGRLLENKLPESNTGGNFSSKKELSEDSTPEDSTPEDSTPEDRTDYELKNGHLKEKIMNSLQNTISNLHLHEINSHVDNLLSILADAMENRNYSPEPELCKRLLVKISPFLHQLSLLAEFFILQQVEAFQITSHLLSRLVPIFKHFAAKGFGIPPDLLPDEDGEDTGKGSGGMGLGEGEGQKDVSERIESEDQLEDAQLPGEREEKDDKDCKEETEGIDTTEDFGGKVQEMQGDESSEAESNNEDVDHEMGEAEGLDDKLDKKIWDGSDDDDDDSEDGANELPDEDGNNGEKIGEPEIGAKDGKRKHDDENELDGNDCDPPKQRKEINELEDPLVDDDQIDPYHGNQKNEDEPEPMDLSDNLQLDDGEGKDGTEEADENPFDVDDMKEQKNPEMAEDANSSVDKEAADTKPDDSDNEDDDEGSENNGEGKERGEERGEDEEHRGDDEGGALENNKNLDTEKESSEQATDETNNDDEATPSYDKASEYNAEPSENENGSKDQVSAELKPSEESVNDGQSQQEENSQKEKQGFGQSEIQEDQEGHHGIAEAKSNSHQQNSELEMLQQQRQRPGISDSKRKLGEVKEPALKRLRTVDTFQNEDNKLHDEEMEEVDDKTSSNVYQHITDATESFDTEVIDAATKEQAEIQPTLNIEDDSNKDTKDDDDNIEMLEDKEEYEKKSEKNQKPEKVAGEEQKQKQGKEENKNDKGNFMQVNSEGEKVETVTVSRGMETTFHTQIMSLDTPISKKEMDEEAKKIRIELENQLSFWTQIPTTVEAEKAWEMFSSVTEGLARDLSEQLRLVLEPTKACRLMGDFRTGRRINMRKVIPYIASEFRKDKIWLRRTRPSKREYQIVLAIDDSSSMNDSHSKELAFESLALLSQALTLLEVGELAVVGFGEKVELLHQLGQPFNPSSGAMLLQRFQFEQKGTRVGQMLQFVTHLLEKCDKGTDRAQLLVIVSDGRGVFSEGKDEVQRAVSLSKLAGILTVFVILDSPNSKDSILDIRTPNFTGGKVTIKSYMDEFPFPFYVILKDINALPTVLSDALRQWFELVANSDNLLTSYH